MKEIGIALVLGVVAAVGCNDSPDEPTPPTPCAGPVTVTVSAGATETRFSWAPVCGVSSIRVTAAPGVNVPQEPHWEVTADAAVIAPPVVYGRVPVGAQGVGPAPLISGRTYRVTLFVPGGTVAVGDGAWVHP